MLGRRLIDIQAAVLDLKSAILWAAFRVPPAQLRKCKGQGEVRRQDGMSSVPNVPNQNHYKDHYKAVPP